MLPFTLEQFFHVFTDYNAVLWPFSIIFYLLACSALGAILTRARLAPWLTGGVLTLMWAWTGIAYHFAFFSTINSAAIAFAALFVAEAALLFHAGVIRRQLTPVPWAGARSGLGWLLIAYAALAYPLIGLAAGHAYSGLPQFGVTPCPVTLFTFGIFLLCDPHPPWRVLVIPVLWSLVGGSAAFLLGVPQDWPLLISGVLGATALLLGRRG